MHIFSRTIPLAAVLLVLALAVPAVAATTTLEALQQQVQQQGARIDRLEAEVQALQVQAAPGGGRGPALDDPLVGTWECTNNVFTYHMTFFADGQLIQESTSFGPMHQLSWKRLGPDEIMVGSGNKVRISMSGKDRLAAERQGAAAKWECSKLTD